MNDDKEEKKFDRNLKFAIVGYIAVLILIITGGIMLLLSLGEF